MGFGSVALLLSSCFMKQAAWQPAGQGFEATHEESVYIGHTLSAGGAVTDSTGAIRVPLEATAMCQDAVWGQRVNIDRRNLSANQVLAFNVGISAIIGGMAYAISGIVDGEDTGKLATGLGVAAVGIPIPAIIFSKKGMARAEADKVRKRPYEETSSWRTGTVKACANDGLAPTLAPQPALSVALPPAAVAVGGTMPITWGSATSVTLAADGVRAMKGWTQECAQASAATIRVDLQGLAAGVNTGATPPRVDDLRALRAVPAASRTGGAMVKLTFGEPTSGELKGVEPLSNAARACRAAAPGRCADGDRLACLQAARITTHRADADIFTDMARLIDEERCLGGAPGVGPDPAACDRAVFATSVREEQALFRDRAASIRATHAAQERSVAAAAQAANEAREAERRREQQEAQRVHEAYQRLVAEDKAARRQGTMNTVMSELQSATQEMSEVMRAQEEKRLQLQAEARARQAADEAARQRAAEEQQARQRAQVEAQRAEQEAQARRAQQAEQAQRARELAAARDAERPKSAASAKGGTSAPATPLEPARSSAQPRTATPPPSSVEDQRARVKEAAARATAAPREGKEEGKGNGKEDDKDYGCGGPADGRRLPLPSCLQEVARSKGPCGTDGLEVKLVNKCDRRIYARVCFTHGDGVQHCGDRALRPGDTWNTWTCEAPSEPWSHNAEFASDPRTESHCTMGWPR
jgi:hypothetical protein